MESLKELLLKRWVSGNLAVYIIALGLCHPLIAHGFTGDHGKLLTASQFTLHTLSLVIFVYLLARTQHKIFQLVGIEYDLARYWPLYLLVPLAFWIGYYTLYVPFDILFMFLSIGILNAVLFRPLVRFPTRWVKQCIATYLLAALAGIVLGLGAHQLCYKNIQGLTRDIATWLTISIPAALIIAYLLKQILKVQILTPEQRVIAPEE